MKHLSRILPILGLLAATTLPTFAQAPSQSSSQPWLALEKELGLPTTYSVDMVIQTMGMNMDTRIVRDGDKSRTEMTMPFMNLKMAALEIPEGGKKVTYMLFPEKQKYVLEDSEDAADSSGAAPKIQEIGKETFNGVECVKRRMTMVEEGTKMDMDMLFSPAVKGMPVKITVDAKASMGPGQPEMPVQTTILFKNYDFATPDAALFAVPAGYTRANDMMEIMMDGSEGLGALMQQMQNMQVEE
jgi:hypothetical protein